MNALVQTMNTEYMKILKPFIGNDTTYSNDLTAKGKAIFGNRYKGTFPSDKLPTIRNRQMYIANLDKSTMKGSHWVAVYKNEGTLYVYDSYGRKSKKIIPSLFQKKGRIIDTEYDAEQTNNQNNCGLRSVSALYLFDNFNPDIIAQYL